MLNSPKKNVAPVAARILQIAKVGDTSVFEQAVKDWMRKAGQDTPEVPTLADFETRQLRHRLIKEELGELAEAYRNGDLTEVADALGDLLYVVVGTAVAHGINLNAIWYAVHFNNLEKIEKGHKDEGGKWIKPEGHLPPDLNSILVMQWRAQPIRADARANTCSLCKVPNIAHKYEKVNISIDAAPGIVLSDTLELVVLCDGRRVKL